MQPGSDFQKSDLKGIMQVFRQMHALANLFPVLSRSTTTGGGKVP